MVSPGWSKPSTLLFPAEIPPDKKVFRYALEQAMALGAHLIIFHAYDTLVVAASETSGIRYYDYDAATAMEYSALEPLAREAREAGVPCEVIVRPGLPAEQILHLMRETPVARVIMGTHGRGALGQLVGGSVAEAVLRSSYVPVMVVGPEVPVQAGSGGKPETVLCAVNEEERSYTVVALAAQIAHEQKARLVIQHVIRPQDRQRTLAGRTLEQLERDLHLLVPINLQNKLQVEAIAVPGDPAEELLYQSKAQQAGLIVMGAQQASILASATHQGVVHTLLAHARCPVLTVSSLAAGLAGEPKKENPHEDEAYLAGVF
jgi:nucleotide-binding universal stress UspA family protein